MSYRPNNRHRDRTPGKSQWTIPEVDELACFTLATAQGWCLADVGWGLHCPNTDPQYLGVAQDHHTEVFLAKFVNGAGEWHGYPADHQRKPQDIPLESILNSWMTRQLLSPAKVRKIVRGQPCTL